MRQLAAALLALVCACAPDNGDDLPPADRAAIAAHIDSLVRSAYDLSLPDPVGRFMSLYDSATIISATAGRITTQRDSLEASIRSFWNGVGQFMVRPSWNWDAMRIDVLSDRDAVMTATYSVPHYTERGAPHVIGGVWTAVWRLGGGGWRITHEHLSDLPRALAESIAATMPFDSSAVPRDTTAAAHGGHAR
ncbi:MAG: YybH family protein [Gemmatimonadota bacterium]